MSQLFSHVASLPTCQLVYLHVLATNTQALGQCHWIAKIIPYILQEEIFAKTSDHYVHLICFCDNNKGSLHLHVIINMREKSQINFFPTSRWQIVKTFFLVNISCYMLLHVLVQYLWWTLCHMMTLSYRVLRQCWIHSASSHTRLLLHLIPSRCCCTLL